MFLGGGLIQNYSKKLPYSFDGLWPGTTFRKTSVVSPPASHGIAEVVNLGVFLSLATHATSTTGAPFGGCVPGSTRSTLGGLVSQGFDWIPLSRIKRREGDGFLMQPVNFNTPWKFQKWLCPKNHATRTRWSPIWIYGFGDISIREKKDIRGVYR